jgi:hypothetical protein
MLARCFLIVLNVLLVGCMPVWFHTYLEPTAAGESRLMRSYCSGTTGPLQDLMIIRDDVRIRIRTARDPNGLSVNVWFEVPENKSVEIPEKIVKATKANAVKFTQGDLRFIGAVTVSPFSFSNSVMEPLEGATHKRKVMFGEEISFNNYHATALIELPESNNYILVLPEIRVNGKLFVLPEVTLTEKTRPEFFALINC